MGAKVEYRINETIKKDYADFIKQSEGKRPGIELEKAIKMYLALNEYGNYESDLEVKFLISRIKDNAVTRTQKSFSGHNGDMDLFAKAFIKEYSDRKEVTRTELSYFASFTQGVTDHRSIQGRINYLIGSGVLTPSAPNIFNIKKGEIMGFR